ncbi:MAG: type II toxin-antitoxin system RelE/ParE family toxin [Acidiferrobacteraceae bacterium]
MSLRRVFKTRPFSRWMRKTKRTDPVLCLAVTERERGLVDADLGGGVVKKRVPLPGRGKSGGARTLVATNRGSRWFFVFGFEKHTRANVSAKEREALQAAAKDLLRFTAIQRDKQVALEALQEIGHDDQE